MKDANCAILVYDVNRPQTLTNLKIWNTMFEEHQSSEAIKIVVGNKIDLDRNISKKDA